MYGVCCEGDIRCQVKTLFPAERRPLTIVCSSPKRAGGKKSEVHIGACLQPTRPGSSWVLTSQEGCPRPRQPIAPNLPQRPLGPRGRDQPTHLWRPRGWAGSARGPAPLVSYREMGVRTSQWAPETSGGGQWEVRGGGRGRGSLGGRGSVGPELTSPGCWPWPPASAP
jgi:hypothetical protein